MPLPTGTRLGPYQIDALLGAGGMGEVYRATDTRLGRQVAIKVLPGHLKANQHLRQRFTREAKAISQLQHPNVCALHDVGSEQGVDFLVMEYLEGETLADRLRRGPLPTADSLEIGAQIAAGIEAAHRRGVVHRDLKPGNVMLTRTGAKVLDFGLAKELGSAPPAADSVSPTAALPLTVEGTIAGTLHYMAPEQVEGGAADARADVWALGAVLYEMASGQRVFSASSPAALVAAILEREPRPLSELVPSIPGRMERLIARCLRKDPEDRWQSASDLRFAIDEARRELVDERSVAGGQPSGLSELAAAAGGRRSAVLASALGLAVVLLVGAITFVVMRPAQSARPIVRSVVSTDPNASPPSAPGTWLAITPDAGTIVYVASDRRLYARPIDRLESRLLTPLVNVVNPFVSPDGAWVGFYDDHEDALKKVPILGGSAVTIAVGGMLVGASWGPDDSIVVSMNGPHGLHRLRASGGELELLAAPDLANGESYRWPQLLPNGRDVLFTIFSARGAEAAVYSAGSAGVKRILKGVEQARYAPTGHLIYGLEGALWAVPFDIERLAVTGAPVAVLRDLVTARWAPGGGFSFSATGDLLYLAGEPIVERMRKMVWVDRGGRREALPAPPRTYAYPRLSPDGQRVAASASNGELWVWDFTRESLTRFGEYVFWPLWSPDGAWILFGGYGAGAEVARRAADGRGGVERLTRLGDPSLYPNSVSPEGDRLVLLDRAASDDLLLLELGGEAMPRPLLATEFHERNGEISPDGRWLAYESDESGAGFEVYVRPFPGVAERRLQVSSGGGVQPLWGRGGGELFYRGPRGVMRVAVEPSAVIAASRPELLFEDSYLFSFGAGTPADERGRAYDVSADGERFLMIEAIEPSKGRPVPDLVLVQNWFEELARLVPAR